MGLAAFNRARIRQTEQHKHRVEEQQKAKIIAELSVEKMEQARPAIVKELTPEKPKIASKSKSKKKGK